MSSAEFTCHAASAPDKAIFQYRAYAPVRETWDHQGVPREAEVQYTLSLMKDSVELGRMPFFTDVSLAGDSPYGRAFLPYAPWLEGQAGDLRDFSSELYQATRRVLGQPALDGAWYILERAQREGWRPHLQVRNEDVDFEAVLAAIKSGRRLVLDKERGVQAFYFDAQAGAWMKSAYQTHYGPRGEMHDYLHDTPVTIQELQRQLWSMTRAQLDNALR